MVLATAVYLGVRRQACAAELWGGEGLRGRKHLCENRADGVKSVRVQ